MAKRVLKKYDGQKGQWLKSGKRFVLELLILIFLLRFLVGVSWVSGESMAPTLHNRTAVVYLRTAGSFQTGDIVSVKMAYGEYYIKRVVACAGDVVDIRGEMLYVNGECQTQWGGGEAEVQESAVVYPFAVPAGKYFVVGDNRAVSVDSRTFGAVSTSQIRGKIIFHLG